MKIYLALFLTFLFNTVAFGQSEPSSQKNTDKAIVYFYSNKTPFVLMKVKKSVFLDDKEIAQIQPSRYFIVSINPGKHIFRLKEKKYGGIEMDFEAGKTYYIQIKWHSGSVPSGIERIQPESGVYDIKQLKPIDSGNIKDKERVFVKLPD